MPTPGHTPGHVAFFRSKDRVLITGDAVLTIEPQLACRDLLTGRHRVSGPPYISTWDWPAAKQSVATLARLRPGVLACGHGRPMTGPQAAASLASLLRPLLPAASSRPFPNRSRRAGRQDGKRPGAWRPSPPAPARMSWKATEEEQAMPLPGDDLVPVPVVQTTHAVTINAPPQQVWPWLVQTGQGRAGFYSDSRFWDRCVDWYYRRLSRQQPGKAAVGYHVAADDRIVAAWQNPRVGGHHRRRPAGDRLLRRAASRTRQVMGLVHRHPPAVPAARPACATTPGWAYSASSATAYLLTEPRTGTTRVIRRMRLSCGPWPFRAYVVPIVLIWGEAITARNLLRGVKRRAEATRSRPEPREAAHLAAALHGVPYRQADRAPGWGTAAANRPRWTQPGQEAAIYRHDTALSGSAHQLQPRATEELFARDGNGQQANPDWHAELDGFWCAVNRIPVVDQIQNPVAVNSQPVVPAPCGIPRRGAGLRPGLRRRRRSRACRPGRA